jgi:ribosome biogenesis GTPase
MKGIIVKQISNIYTVYNDNHYYDCNARGKFRNQRVSPLVGDKVLFDEKKKIIEEIEPRKNALERPPISNVDQAFIITSVKEPDLDTNLLDKLLAVIEFNNIKPIICLTKIDLLNKDEQEEISNIKKYYQNIGYFVYTNQELEAIKKQLTNKITVFTGQSGAGKSTLLNFLDHTLNLKTGVISEALGRGRHTTRHTELWPMENGWVADTPGFSALSFTDMSVTDIRDNFIDFNLYRENCEYRDCMHTKEENCGIKKALAEEKILKSRYDNYLSFISER